MKFQSMAGKQGMVHSDKRTYERVSEAEFVDKTADAIVAGTFEPRFRNAAPLTEDDARYFQRITSLKLEDFNAKLGERLGVIADKISRKINEKLEDDMFKTSELAYLYSVMEDKRATLTGRAQLQASQVNVQINNYGSNESKDQILDRLFPSKDKPALLRVEELADVI